MESYMKEHVLKRNLTVTVLYHTRGTQTSKEVQLWCENFDRH